MSIAPADYASWHDVRTELMAEAKTGFKARVEAELAAGTLAPCNYSATTLPHHTTTTSAIPAGGENLDELKAAFQQEERAIEHQIDHTVHTFSASVDVSYNVRRLPPVEPLPAATHSHAVPFARGSSSRTSRRARAPPNTRARQRGGRSVYRFARAWCVCE